MKGTWGGALLIALGAAISTSCALLTPATVETQKEMLTKIPVALPEGKMHPATLLISAPETSAVYNTTQMAYAIRPYQIAYFSRTEWGERPSRMIHPLLVQTLEKAGYFSAVVTPPFMGRYTHALRTEILVFQQDFTSEPATLRLALRVQLVARTGKQAIATKEIDVREPIWEKTPHGGAVADLFMLCDEAIRLDPRQEQIHERSDAVPSISDDFAIAPTHDRRHAHAQALR